MIVTAHGGVMVNTRRMESIGSTPDINTQHRSGVCPRSVLTPPFTSLVTRTVLSVSEHQNLHEGPR
jgi:hypothetical protein